jgi:hypothetical protein
MSITSEVVNQSIFTAALFLTFISVPKLLMLTGWYTYRIAIYWFGARLTKSKSFEGLIQQKEILASVQKNMQNPLKIVERMLKETGNYTKDIRDPIIEALVALTLMILVFPLFPQISNWLALALLLIVAVIGYAFALLLITLKEVNRLKISQELNLDYEI